MRGGTVLAGCDEDSTEGAGSTSENGFNVTREKDRW
jgi:hypothetical protein